VGHKRCREHRSNLDLRRYSFVGKKRELVVIFSFCDMPFI
jgi:hypothetical protein